MPYRIVVRTSWLVAVILVVSSCSAPASQTDTAAVTSSITLTTAATTTAGAAATTTATAATTTAAPPAVVLPDRRLTPGAIDPRVTQADIGRTICVSGYTATVRPPESVTEAIKVQAVAAYGRHDSLSDYELDHLIPLEVGGAPADIRNLWPEPYEKRGAASGTGAETKDKVENAARQAVCSGRLPLAAAQQAIAVDWYAFGRALGVI